ncbi:hypothetical protein [Phytomonospora endophytica]|uniref:Uncharacterized protein n=1 Tax=Phytomonospora endophytica TaxID=714109 RepID=A0A841F9R2_9ACTN|nr:hypothetical protein [Phytomonospora endophytica]MBB6032484.1 hypothetical protein [Phytomonospora endophytica]GIG66367.1 hypothetical protein Pen01_26620 [Phytomonospora endophytica]
MSPTHMPHDHEQAFSTLIGAAGPLDWTGLTSSLRGEFLVVLRKRENLPGGLLDTVLASDDAAMLQAVTGNPGLRHDPAVRERLAATGHPAVALAAGEDPALRRATLKHADPEHPGWHGPEGALARLRQIKNLTGLRPMVHAPFPDLIEHALTVAPVALSERERGHALRGLYRHDGAETARIWAELLGGKVGELALAELDAGGDLSGLLAWAEGTESAIRELRPGQRADLGEQAAQRSTLDWPLIAAAHAAEPFDERAARALVERHDCPPEIVAVLYAAHPLAVAEIAGGFDARVWHGVKASASVLGKSTRMLTRRALADGLSCGLLTDAAPATAVLAGTRGDHAGDAHPALAELTAAVAKLGDDPAAWRALRAALKSARGTVTDLFGHVSAMVGDGKAPASWPEAAPAPTDGKAPSLSGAREAFIAVFDRATVEVRLALLPVLDDRTRFDVFTRAAFDPRLMETAIARDETWAAMLAARIGLDADWLHRLLALDSPVVNARIFHRTGATPEQRRAILSGTRFGPGEGPVPLHPELRDRLLAKTGGWRGTDAVDCADTELQEHILRHVRVRGERPQLRLLLNAWERHGKDRALHLISDSFTGANYSRRPIGRGAKSRLRKLAAMPEPAAALAALRAELDATLTAEWQVAELRREREDHFVLARESHVWLWPRILAAHRTEPLPAKMLAAMRHEINELPAELDEAAAAQGNAWDEVLSSPGGPLRRLRAEALDAGFVNGFWLSGCLTSGQLNTGQVLTDGFPAMRALSLTAQALAEEPEPLTELLAGTVGDRPDAWLLALRMLPEFRGTVAELLRTAAVAA